MKALFIGGTGIISMAITQRIAREMPEWELTLLNRGKRRTGLPAGVRSITADIGDEERVRALVAGETFDVVADFIAFQPEQVERDIRLFAGKTGQYFYISSASAYQKPVVDCRITESTPLANPYWQYSRDKIACEELLLEEYRKNGFPVTVIRPSHTYGDRNVPVAIHGKNGFWQVLRRMLDGKPVIIHGDGTSLWTLTSSEDFAKGFTGLMGNIHAIGQAVHITSDESLAWNQIYACIAAALGVELKAVHIPTDLLGLIEPSLLGGLLGDKACSVLFDNGKLKRLVPGFCAAKRFDQGVRESVSKILASPELQVEDPAFDAWCDDVIARWRGLEESFRSNPAKF